MDEQEQAVMRFCRVTSATPDQARFFLESSAWDLDAAMETYFEVCQEGAEDDMLEGQEGPEEDQLNRLPAPTTRVQHQDRSSGVPLGGGQPGSSNSRAPKDKKPSVGRGGIKTLSDLNKRASDSDEEDGTQEYFTGGEKSGMMVQDPQKGNQVDELFAQARRMAAQEGPLEPPKSGRPTFMGMGRTLSGEPSQHGSDTVPAGVAGPPRTPDPIIRNITFWRNGFTVDDGQLRRLDDPANAQFLMSISRSECPKELEPADRGTPVHVNLIRRSEDWMAPVEPRNVAFTGVGKTLGSSSTGDAGNVCVLPSSSIGPFSQGLTVDGSRPVTSIQVRLSDGTRMIARFNYYHTIADIRRFIDAARPGHAGNYQLQTMGFPPKVLSDASETIEAAGLLNAVVIQKV